jgi:hypothetical protein
MLKKIVAHLGVALLLLFGQSVYASSGLLFNVTATGAPGNVSINLCLNGKGPLSCQNFNVSALTLSISPTVPNHVYPAIGIKINTPGYTLANLGIACTPTSNGYCLFSASQAAPKTLIIQSSNTPTANSVGGTVTGLTGTVTLLNNGVNSSPISTDGLFTFSTPVAEGSTYSVTVGTQPTNQTCTVANGSGTMGAANVTNVTVTCANNTYSVGGNVTGITGPLELQNNSGNPTTVSANGPFTFSTLLTQGSPYNVTVSVPPTGQICTVTNGSGTIGSSNVTNVGVNCTTPQPTTLSVTANGIIPYTGSTLSQNLTVTNTGANTAYNVKAVLPVAWTGVTQNFSNCATIAAGGTCTLSFTSTTPYIAQGSIPITGDNISTPLPTTALAFSVGGYLVWSVDPAAPASPTSVQVIDTADLSSSPEPWGGYGTAVGSSAQSFTNGSSAAGTLPVPDNAAGNTSAIFMALGAGNAAGDCYNNNPDGTTAAGTWYLPAICQMGGSGGNANCAPGLANIDTNLVQLGFGSLAGYYWSSTEDSVAPQLTAWFESFASGGSFQAFDAKNAPHGVRCSRALSL